MPIREDFEEKRLKLLVDLVEFVDQQDDGLRLQYCLQQWAVGEEVERVELDPQLFPLLVEDIGLRFEEQPLQRLVE